MQSGYTKNRKCFSYELSKIKGGEITRYLLFDNSTLKHLESYDTTRHYNNGSICGFGCLTEDTSKTTQKKVKTYNNIDNKIFELVNLYK